jgi:hypothetical protein
MREVPAGVAELACKLAGLFESDSRIVERLNDAQRRLRFANDQLWSGLHPDAVGLAFDDMHRVTIHDRASVLAGLMFDALRTGAEEHAVEITMVQALQQTHWIIGRAFRDYQSACEERRQLAVDVGELSQRLVEALTAVGWSEEAARGANVHELATAGAR